MNENLDTGDAHILDKSLAERDYDEDRYNHEKQTILRDLESRNLQLHPYVKAQIESWEKHYGIKLAAFGHHKFSSSISVSSTVNLNKEQARQEVKRCQRRN